jgi:hypothetical protein
VIPAGLQLVAGGVMAGREAHVMGNPIRGRGRRGTHHRWWFTAACLAGERALVMVWMGCHQWDSLVQRGSVVDEEA